MAEPHVQVYRVRTVDNPGGYFYYCVCSQSYKMFWSDAIIAGRRRHVDRHTVARRVISVETICTLRRRHLTASASKFHATPEFTA